jgi:glycosyltransferase involved in cell wall biosynthesis
MLVVSLVTLGSPEQLTGGYLYHRRLADVAADYDARVQFVSAGWLRDPIRAVPDADVVVVDSIAAWRVAPWLRGRRTLRPLAAIVHQPPGGIDHGRLRSSAQAILDRSLYRRCAAVIAASQALADDLVVDHGLPADRLVVVAPGRDVTRGAMAGGDDDHRGPVSVLSVGNWMARKGTLELLEAFARLPPAAATLHLVGRDDVERRYARRVRQRMARPDLAERVVVHGPLPVEKLAQMYAAADLFALPSYIEPYGTVYGEALASGLPIVGWRAGNLPNLIDDGCEGVLVEPGDIDALAAAIDTLTRDATRRHDHALAARRRGASLPTWHDTATQFFGVLRAVASSAV